MIYILPLYFLLLIQNSVDKNYLLGRFDPAKDSRFVKPSPNYTRRIASHDYLRTETYQAFVKMAKAAVKDGVKLEIISATRNFDDQKKIWENKWTGKIKVEEKYLTTVSDLKERALIIMHFSSMPGTSRHHWGTDMDLNSWDNNYFEKGEGEKIYDWLTVHAGEYGFCQPYTNKANGRTGYEEEKWHWSYLPLSKLFLKEYKKQISYGDLNGFDGYQQADSLKVIDFYVDGVACR